MALEIQMASVTVQLLPERALFWPDARTLFVADLHWGKRETFVVEGIPLPGGLLDDELTRLERLVERHAVQRIVVLGDLIHSREGITDEVVERVARFRNGGPEMWLVRGNHDRHLPTLPARWNLVVSGDRVEGPFVLSHEPRVDSAGYVLSGHIHPALRLRTRGDGLRVPCFHVTPRFAVLPAFSEFTGGAVIRPKAGERAFAVTANTVIEI